MSRKLAEFVAKRAGYRCEYCHLPKSATVLLFEVDHIVAEQHGGPSILDNLAYACFACNHHKGPNLAGIDPLTKKRTWLFHPREQRWISHFRWQGPLLIGKTAIGRTTIEVLAINVPIRGELRRELMELGIF